MKEAFKKMVKEVERDFKVYLTENGWAVEVRGEIWTWCPTKDGAQYLAWTFYYSEKDQLAKSGQEKMAEEFQRDYKIHPVETSLTEDPLWSVTFKGETMKEFVSKEKAKDFAWTHYLGEQLSVS